MTRLNLYAVLGVSSRASQEEIKAAYRALAQKWHPDKATGDEAHFKRISEAYGTLSNAKRRSAWDAERVFWLAKNQAVDCPACGTPIKLPGIEGLQVDCKSCGHKAVIAASPTGKIKLLGIEFLQGTADRVEGLAEASITVSTEDFQRMAHRYVKRAARTIKKFIGNHKMPAPKLDEEE